MLSRARIPFVRHWLILASVFFTLCATHAEMVAIRLTCEYLQNPLGIDTASPRLSWVLDSGHRNQRQTAYQILVATTEKLLKENKADLWNSGKVDSEESLQIPYRGLPLKSGQRCYWMVRSWDQNGRPSDYSRPAWWEMGLLNRADWKGQWIGATTNINSLPAPLLRKDFKLKGGIKQARAYICGLGYYELRINGEKIGNHLLDPGYTRYDKRALYVTYDVTRALERGANSVGVILGNGWYNVQTRAVWNFHEAPWRAAPALLMQIQVDYHNGTSETIATDTTWKTSPSPIVFNSIYGGETYDARLEQPGWDTAGFDDSKWSSALSVTGPAGKLAAQMMPPIKAAEILKPVSITTPKPEVFVFDMGQNFAGISELKLRGPAGTKIVMKYSERLGPDGMIDRSVIQQHIARMDTNQQFQTDTYILKGKGDETWRSRFDYHGYQYVEVTGYPGTPSSETLRGVSVHSAVPPAGQFECSNQLLNRIWHAGLWSYLSNLEGIPTDCPHREKNGWTGDAHLAAEQGLFNFAPAAVYTKWLNDLADEQQPSGELPGIVPTSGWGYKWGNGPAWDSAMLLLPYYMNEYCADTRVLTSHYENMKRYVDYLTGKAKDHIINFGLNDWAPFKTKTPTDITSTAYYYRDVQITAQAARLLGKKEEAEKLDALAADIRKAFNAKFYQPATGSYDNGSQTSLSCALYQGLVEPENRERVVSNLVFAVENANNHIDTGILGAKYILNALTENGRPDVAYRIASQNDLPSWGWWIEQGATTLWEQWNGEDSRNHIMYGDISAWFYKALAGINPDPAAPGFKHFTIKPNLLGDLTSAKATYDSSRGKIVSDWKLIGDEFQLTVVVPANSTATIHIPTSNPASVREGTLPATSAEGLRSLPGDAADTVFLAGSGTYRFHAKLPSAKRR